MFIMKYFSALTRRIGAHGWIWDHGFWLELITQILVGGFLFLMAVQNMMRPEGPHSALVYHSVVFILLWIGGGALFLGLLVQRARKILGLGIVIAALLLLALGPPLVAPLGYVVVCYQSWFISAYIQRHRWAWGIALVFGSAIGLTLIPLSNALRGKAFLTSHAVKEPNFWVGGAGVLIIIIISISLWWQIGLNTKRKNQALEELRAKAELAALAERNRIAREMHDIVAHSLTVVIAQADGGRYAGKKDPMIAIEALETISSVGRDALSQMRGLLTVLREATGEKDEREINATPGFAEIGRLIDEARSAGLQVNFSVHGEPVAVDESRGLTVFRVIQESLTNVLKHAGKTVVDVTLDWGVPKDKTLHISVDNAHGEALVNYKSDSVGRGLAGIKERALLHGGKATWGASLSNAGGWRVNVEIPL
ncbi:histidine kinase [Corynebacterium pseudotuberculosis 31]|nr:histidine kinase [Corynebacterium pseudotuberculosis 31]